MLSLQPLIGRIIFVAALIYFTLIVYNSVTRTGRFSPDSMNYVNVARNIAAGKGITQPTLGFNQPRFGLDDKPPSPFTAQAPLYPIMIALVSRTGLAPEHGALLLSSVAYGIVFLLVHALAAALYNQNVALTAVSVLLFYEPLRWIADFAWTDGIGTALMLLALWLLASPRRDRWFLLCAGLATGLAFATRYAFLPLFFAGAVFLLITSQPWRCKLIDASLYAFGGAIPAGLVWGRNLLVSGAVMPSFLNDNSPFVGNAMSVFRALFEDYSGVISSPLPFVLLGLSLVAISLSPMARHGLGRHLREIVLSQRRSILLVWVAAFLGFLIVGRSYSHFDIDARVVAPAGVVMIVLWSVFALQAVRIPGRWISLLALSLLALGIWREARVTARTPPFDLQEIVRSSEQLTWIANYTSNQDLIIGDDTIDIPFYLQREATVSFSPYPYTEYPTYEKIIAYARKHCGEYRKIYLVLHRSDRREQEYRSRYGEFFTDIMYGRVEKYPEIIVVRHLGNGSIHKIECD